MVDIHCHLLPGVDDGPKSWDIALEMCRMAAKDGITHIVATPHANEEFAYDRAQHLVALDHLRELTGDVPELSLGCDFHLSYDNIQNLVSGRSKYTIGETHYLLIELSDFSIPPQLPSTICRLLQLGLYPVLTHPERNPLLQRTPEQVLRLVDSGCIVQVTANSVTGFWGKQPQKIARWLLDRGAVHVIATDAHDTRRRPPLLSAARDRVADWAGEDVARALVETNPGAIVSDEKLPYFPAPVL